MAKTAEEWITAYNDAVSSGDSARAGAIQKGLSDAGVNVSPGPTSESVVDDGKGVSALDRAKIAALKPEQAIQYLSEQYGEADQLPGGEFVVRNPGSESWRRANPEGFDVGDLAQHGKIAAQVIGGGLAGAAGGLVSTPTIAGIPAGVLAGGAAGSTAAGEGYDAIMRRLAGQPDARSTKEKVIDVGTNAALDLALPVGLSKLGGAVRAGMSGIGGRPGAGEVYDAAARQGVRPTAGMLGAERAEGILASLPGGAARAQDEAGEQIGAAITGRLDDITTMSTPQQVGVFIEDRAGDYVSRFKSESSSLYGAVDSLVPEASRFRTDNVRQLINQRAARFADDPEYGDLVSSSLTKKLAAISDKPDASYAAISELRSAIGRRLGDKSQQLVSDIPTAELKGLYKALSQDLASGMGEHGEAASMAFKAANEHYAEGMGVIDKTVSPVLGRTGRPEDIAARLTTQNKRGASALQDLSGAGVLAPDDMEQLGAAAIRQSAMSRPQHQNASGDAFSPATFHTKIGQMSPEARGALFDNTALKDIVDDAMLLTDAHKRAGSFINRSQTAPVGFAAGTTTGAATSLMHGNVPGAMGFAAAGAAPLVGNRVLQSDNVLKLLAGRSEGSVAKQEMLGLFAASASDDEAEEDFISPLIRQ